MRHVSVAVLLLCLMGCAVSPPARREIALLKNEILDLQNQYFALKAEYFRATGNEPVLDHWLPPADDGSWQDPVESYEIILGDRQQASEPARHVSQIASAAIAPTYTADNQSNRAEPLNEYGFRTPRVPSGSSGVPPALMRGVEPSSTHVQMESQDRDRASRETSSEGAREAQHLEADGYWDDGPSPESTPDHLRVVFQGVGDVDRSDATAAVVQFSLLDIARPNGSQRIGFWELNAAQLQQLQSLHADGKTIDLLLPWPTQSTPNSELQLFARVRLSGNEWVEQSTIIANPQEPVGEGGRP